MQKHLLVVENDPFHLKFIEDQLADEAFTGHKINLFDDGDKACDWLNSQSACHAIIDLNLPGKNGVEVATRVWQRNQSASIVFWSNFSDPAYARAIARIVPESGNFGYVLKTMSRERLQRSLKGVLFDGQRIIDGEVQGLINRQNTRRDHLTQVETEILNLIAVGLTDRAISKMIGISQRSIQAFAAKIYEKFSGEEISSETMNKRSRLIALAVLNGEVNRDSLLEHEKLRLKRSN